MGANHKLKTGSKYKDRVRGTLFYSVSTGTAVDGGVSETFADSFYWNQVPNLIINDKNAQTFYIYKNTIADRPSYGSGDISGLMFQFEVTDKNPNAFYTNDWRGLLAYKLRDLPVQKGSIAVSDASHSTWAPASGVTTDFYVYSSTHENKKINDPTFDFAMNFSNLENKIYDQIVTTDYDTVVAYREPHILLADLQSNPDKCQGYNMDRYSTVGPDGSVIVELKNAKVWDPGAQVGKFMRLADV